jgi:hypothetical protein
MAFELWITVPANNVRVKLPMSLFDDDVEIMFRDKETINNVIDQLQKLKEIIPEQGLFMYG